MRYALVALGGALAALARYSTSVAVGLRTFPYATLTVNVTGAFLFGVVATLVSRGRFPRDLGTAATVGFLGAYTTFATFAWETFELVRAGRVSTAGTYVALSVVGGAAVAWAGHSLVISMTTR